MLVFYYFFYLLSLFVIKLFFSWWKSFIVKGKYVTFWIRIFIHCLQGEILVLWSWWFKDLCLPSLYMFNLFIIYSRLKYCTSKSMMSVYKLFKFYNKDLLLLQFWNIFFLLLISFILLKDGSCAHTQTLKLWGIHSLKKILYCKVKDVSSY